MTSTIAPLEAINDFVVKFANVNGSGSASANELFAKSILRMGVPIASRNIFPSNIQGLPTWFEVRVSEAGHMGRRGGVDRHGLGARRCGGGAGVPAAGLGLGLGHSASLRTIVPVAADGVSHPAATGGNGRSWGTRTHDPRFWRPVLYQLS